MFDPAAAVGLTAFFTKALQPEASDRYGTADEMYWAWHEAFRASAAPATRSHHPDAYDDFVIPQSLAICEYLEEIHPEPQLLPGSARDRAIVRGIEAP